LFEMLTGRQAFESGGTISDSIAAILKSEPDWNALPADTPPSVRTLIRRCLHKDPQKRLPHIGIARLEIEEWAAGTGADRLVPAANTRARSDRIAWRAAAIAL